ncbi:MAG: hypothetical protein EP348_02705 [Alphaproteobacteria bacterium]|nr:MAG: hypothetical protein EP348_02705 [Alphaproteobacteria bacterium]
MDREHMNKFVAKELSEALRRCQQQGVDASTVRTGLLTITIANFVNGIGFENTLTLFEALPQQIQSGLFDKFSPNGRVPRRMPPFPQSPSTPSTNQPAGAPAPLTEHAVIPYAERNPSSTTAPTQPAAAPPIRRRRL